MKIGIITDIHNNLVALQAVLNEFHDLGIEKIICCGDLIGIGPRPDETVKTIMSLKNLLACVRGNHEDYFLKTLPSTVPNEEHMDWGEIEQHKWEHHLLSEESKKFLENLPYEEYLEIYGVNIYISHYCRNVENKFIHYNSNPTGDELDFMFSDIKADIIIYGHNHTCSSIHGKDTWYLNCGALGCPSSEKDVARAGILEISPSEATTFRPLNIRYDVESVIHDIETLKYPDYNLILNYFYGISK